MMQSKHTKLPMEHAGMLSSIVSLTLRVLFMFLMAATPTMGISMLHMVDAMSHFPLIRRPSQPFVYLTGIWRHVKLFSGHRLVDKIVQS